MKRRFFIVFLAAVIAFAGMPVLNTSASVEDDVSITPRVSPTRIFKDDNFTLYLTFSDESGDINEDEVSLSMITNNIFAGSLSIDKGDFKFDEEYSFSLKYLGGSENLPLNIEYKKGKDGQLETGTLYVVIDAIEEDSVSPPSGSSDNEPNLIIESTSIPAAAAGGTMKIPLTITNQSRYAAKNITVELSLDNSDNSPFDMENLNLVQSISSLSAKKSEGVIFDLKVKPYAEEIYPGILNNDHNFIGFRRYRGRNTGGSEAESI
jgi:hypothetical protein